MARSSNKMPKNENSLKNLKRFKKNDERTRELAKKGQKESVKSRKFRMRAKECMNLILELKVKGKGAKSLMDKLGIKDEDQQNIMLLMASMYKRAVETGDPYATKSILEIAGDLDTQTEQASPTININVSAATTNDRDDE